MNSKWGVERNEASREKITTSYNSILNGNDKAQTSHDSLKMISEWVMLIDVIL